MSDQTSGKGEVFEMYPIGYVQRSEDKGTCLEILEQFRPALKQLDHFTHVVVLWWADRSDNDEARGRLRTRPPYAPEHETGLFACRAEYRPNPIMTSTCKLLGVDEADGIVTVNNIDAIDGTPIVDLKAYFPVTDRVKDARIPEWLEGWPEWLPDEGIGLQE